MDSEWLYPKEGMWYEKTQAYEDVVGPLIKMTHVGVIWNILS